MPDRAYYVDAGAGMAEKRQQYQAHVAKVLELAGDPEADAKAQAARILALEIAIAKAHATQEDTNDVKKGANYWARADFDTKAPGMDWQAFLEGAQLGQQPRFVVWHPKAITGISKLVASQPLGTWKEYLRFRALDGASGLLPKAFADERFAFYGTTMAGTPQQQERWKRGVAAVDGALGEAVGKIYVAAPLQPAGEGARGRDGAQPARRLRQAHRQPRVDDRADQGARQGQARRPEGLDGLSGQVARLLRAGGPRRRRARQCPARQPVRVPAQPGEARQAGHARRVVHAAAHGERAERAAGEPPGVPGGDPGSRPSSMPPPTTRSTTVRSARSSATRSRTASIPAARCSTSPASCRTGGRRRT